MLSHRRLPRQCARSARPVRVNDVGERRHEDRVNARTEWNRREYGHDPGRAVVGQEGERYKDAAYLSHRETELRWRISTVHSFCTFGTFFG